MGGAKVPRTPPLGGVAQPDPSAPAPEPDPPETERGFDAENHPLAGVPNVEAGCKFKTLYEYIFIYVRIYTHCNIHTLYVCMLDMKQKQPAMCILHLDMTK